MNNFFTDGFRASAVLENFFGEILSWVVIGLLALMFAQSARVLQPFIYRYFGKNAVYKFFQQLISILASSYSRFVMIALLLVLLNLQERYRVMLSVAIALLGATLVWYRGRRIFDNPVAVFSDDFSDQRKLDQNWRIKTGEPFIDPSFGKPAPDLELKYIESQATCSFLWLKEHPRREGIIEFDFYLERRALVNLVFFADNRQDNWLMARFDSRKEYSDGLLIKDGGPGNNWREFSMSGTTSSARRWIRARVEFSERYVKIYKDGMLITELVSPRIFGDSIGIFNEAGQVHVDNFSITDLIANQ